MTSWGNASLLVHPHDGREYLMAHGEELLNRYERWMRSVGRTPGSIAQRLRMAETVLTQWPEPDKATATDLTEWLGRDDLSRASRATYHSDVRAFFKWLALANLIDADPTASPLFERPKVRAGVPQPLTADEEERALAHARGNMRAWLLLALRAGLRASEIASFRGEQVTPRYIMVVGKGEKPATVRNHPDILALAEKYPRRGWWFPSPAHDGHISGKSVGLLVGRFFRSPKVDIQSGSIHRCRHSYATSLLQNGANMYQVQAAMRHSSLATTAIYAAIDEDELGEIVARLGRPSLAG
jgi:integrase/recombinase XerD